MTWKKDSVLLATGVTVPRIHAAAILFLLGKILAGSPEDRSLVICLRGACVTDESIPAKELATLVDCGLAEPDGTISPTVRDVVRAAIRGERSDLHLVSPYVTEWDRVLCDLINSRETVRAALPTERAESLIAGTIEGILGILSDEPPARPQQSWVDNLLKRRPPGSGFSPPSRN